MAIRERDYVAHVCKNSKKPEFIDDPSTYKKSKKNKIKNPEYCDRIWVDIDRTHPIDIPTTKFYCPECQAKGFKNKKVRLSSVEKLKQEQQLQLARDAKKRKR